jgi:hypothetical protein
MIPEETNETNPNPICPDADWAHTERRHPRGISTPAGPGNEVK